MMDQMVVESGMSKEELDELIKSLPQFLKELEQYIIDNNTQSI